MSSMKLYRETECEHGRLERHGPAKCKHGFDTLHVGLGAEYACGGPIAEWCLGGSREEVVIDYEAAAHVYQELTECDDDNPPCPACMAEAESVILAALKSAGFTKTFASGESSTE